jgi:hypothetical protein
VKLDVQALLNTVEAASRVFRVAVDLVEDVTPSFARAEQVQLHTQIARLRLENDEGLSRLYEKVVALAGGSDA